MLLSKEGVQQFGEAFLKTIEQERNFREQARRDKLDMESKQRYYDYLNKNMQQEGNKFVYQNFAPANILGGRENPRTGQVDYETPSGIDHTPMYSGLNLNKTLGANIPEGNYIMPANLPPPPKPDNIIGKVTTNENGTPVISGYTGSGKMIPFGIDFNEQTQRYNATKSTNKTEKSYVEDPLKQWQLESGLNILQNPSFINKDKSGEVSNKTPDELKVQLDDAINNVGSAYLDSETMRWLYDLKSQYNRYPNPNELRDEIVQDGQSGVLNENQLQRLNSFLNVYYKAYGGVNQLQRRIINPQSYELK